MNYITRLWNEKINKALLSILAFVLLAGLGVAVSNSASARTQYTPGGTGTTSTPVFNEFYDVPNGVGDEADFVRVKPQAGGNGDYVNTLNDACNTGSIYTVRTYVHNGADPTFNEGEATAVAHNTVVSMNVKTFNKVQKDFVFTSTIDASNAASMTDSAQLKCGQDVVMKLVPKSVEVYSKPTGFNSLPDSAVNGTTKIGSRTVGSGDVFACWEDRVIIVYEVVVEKKPVVVLHPAVCEALLVTTLANNKVRVDDVKYEANDAKINNVNLNYGDGTNETVNFNQLPRTHTYSKAGTYKIRATINTTFEGKNQAVTSDNCVKEVTVKKEKTPEYACEMFNLKMNDRTANVSFLPTASNGATFKDATITYYGDGDKKNEDTTNKQNAEGKVTSSFTYAEGVEKIKVVATVRFNIGEGKDQYTKTVTCEGQAVLGTHIDKCIVPGKEHLPADSPDCVEPVPPTTTIPDTGAGSFLGLLAAVAAVGAVAHRTLTLKRQ